VNAELIKELSSVENYLTCVFLRLDHGVVEYANAGHPEIMFRRAGKAAANLLVPRRVDDYKGPPIGREFIEAPYRAVKFRMAPGDSLLMCTDGLIESKNKEGQLFDSASLLTAMARAPDGSAEEMLSYILDEWRFHMDSQLAVDDITAVLIKRKKT
jgi:serine phosphatase RsbU (regulator of sigma subunit)